jgi:hypothetical protein
MGVHEQIPSSPQLKAALTSVNSIRMQDAINV